MQKKRYLTVLFTALYLFASSIHALPITQHYARSAWQPAGPPGGLFIDVTSAKDKRFGEKVFASSYWTSIYMSDDHGQTWEVSDNGLSSLDGYGTSFIANAQVAYTQGGGAIYITHDGGKTWHKTMNGLDKVTNYMTGIDEQTVYTSTLSRSGIIYKTSDAGEHWEKRIDPRGDGWGPLVGLSKEIVFAVDYPHSTVWRSQDSGKHWDKISIEGKTSFYLADADVTNGIIFMIASTNPTEGNYFLYKSLDTGLHWERVSNTHFSSSTIISFANEKVAYAGHWEVKKTIDGGKTWSNIDKGLPFKDIHSIHAASENEVYVNTQIGLYQTLDGGQTWHLSGKGISAHEVNQIASNDGHSIFLVTNRGGLLYHSGDAGQSWELYNNDKSPHGGLMGIAPTNDDVLYLYECGIGVLKSTDGGKHRRNVLPDKDWDAAGNVQLIAPSKKVVYFNVSDGIGDVRRLVKTTDGGEHWRLINHGLSQDWVDILSVVDEKELYAAIRSELFHSIDGGEHWTPWGVVPSEKMVKSITHFDDKTLLIAVEDDAFKTTDGGLTWQTIFPAWPESPWHSEERDEFSGLYCLNQQMCFIAFAYHGVYQTLDAGENWLPINQGLKLPNYFGQLTGMPGHLFLYGGFYQAQEVYSLSLDSSSKT
jgi:photosystem II stability/assembly factor-like uncharacterized protein